MFIQFAAEVDLATVSGNPVTVIAVNEYIIYESIMYAVRNYDHFSLPNLVRWTHPHRGPTSSYKQNIESDQILYDLTFLTDLYDNNSIRLVDRLTDFENGDVLAVEIGSTNTPVSLLGSVDLANRIDRLSFRVTTLEQDL